MNQIAYQDLQKNIVQLLERVKQGEHFFITENEEPFAALTPVSSGPRPLNDTIEKIRLLSLEQSLGDLSVEELIKKGRRF